MTRTERTDTKFFRKMELLGLITFVAFALVAAVIYSRAQATTQERSDTKTTLRTLICYVEKASVANATTTDEAARIIIQTNKVLAVIKAAPCPDPPLSPRP